MEHKNDKTELSLCGVDKVEKMPLVAIALIG
jgi:hypothetical protein